MVCAHTQDPNSLDIHDSATLIVINAWVSIMETSTTLYTHPIKIISMCHVQTGENKFSQMIYIAYGRRHKSINYCEFFNSNYHLRKARFVRLLRWLVTCFVRLVPVSLPALILPDLWLVEQKSCWWHSFRTNQNFSHPLFTQSFNFIRT